MNSLAANGVSIPRRYAKNQNDANHLGYRSQKFQSLVGTLKTYPGQCIFQIWFMFQSLVGTLKT